MHLFERGVPSICTYGTSFYNSLTNYIFTPSPPNFNSYIIDNVSNDQTTYWPTTHSPLFHCMIQRLQNYTIVISFLAPGNIQTDKQKTRSFFQITVHMVTCMYRPFQAKVEVIFQKLFRLNLNFCL